MKRSLIKNKPMSGTRPTTKLERELAKLINEHSLEGGSDTADWILANYLIECLRAFNGAIFSKENQKREFFPPKDKLFVNEFLKDQKWEKPN